MLSQIETCRAHQVADVLDEQQIDVGEPNLVQRAVDHRCVEMAGVAGGDLNCRHALRANAPGIVLGREVAFHDADAILRPQPANGGFEQRRLAGSRG